jgi:hypothetical protein
MHSGTEGMNKAAKIVWEYFWGILKVKNNCIQRIKRITCEFQNKDRFIISIMFHLGNLDSATSSL